MCNNDNSILLPFLEKEKLSGNNFLNNFLDWHHDLIIVLKQVGKESILEAPIPLLPENGGTIDEIMAEKNAREQSISVACLMLLTMDFNFQRQFENMDAYNMIVKLKTMFRGLKRSKMVLTMNAILDTKLEEGKPVGPHVQKMIGYFEIMEHIGSPFTPELATVIIFRSLHDGFNEFRKNFIMYETEKPLIELLNMLQTFEQIINIKPKMQCLMVCKGEGFKKNGTKKSKKNASPSESTCLYCKKIGHFKRDCHKYKDDEKNGCLNLHPFTSGPKKK